MLLTAELYAQISESVAPNVGYLVTATPGAPNSELIDLGPIIDSVDFTPQQPAPNQPIVVTAEINASESAVNGSTALLHYRLMFGAEVAIPMTDDGLGVDETSGDGVYSAQIPGIAEVGEMIRWYITAEDVEGKLGRGPRFADPLDSAEYFGTVVLDPSASEDIAVMYWFVQDEAAAETRTGTRASLYYLGEFYDNISVDLHGQSTAGTDFPKKSFDFDSNKGQKFQVREGLPRHSDFNLLANYADQTKVRNFVAYGTFAETGAAHHLTFPVHVHRNGEFYGLYDFVEQGDSEHLERLGLDPNGALYKVNNNLEASNSAYINVDKLTRKDEDRSDLEQVVLADDLTGIAATRWDYDNLDIADVVNYLAVQSVIQNGDFGHKNFYLYRDTENTKLWQILPWDVDLSFGHLWRANVNPPYFSNTLFTNGSIFAGFNDIIQRLYQEPRFREMYGRRLRTVSDQILGSPGTNVADSWAWQQFELWDSITAHEAIQDANKWGIHPNFTHTPAQAVDQIQNNFITARRNYIANQSIVPSAQANVLNVNIAAIESNPVSGDRREEYFVLTNNETFAADISDWTISGSVSHTFKPGTVIPAGQSLYVVADVQGFQARTAGPGGGLALHQQGNYAGQLSDFGGTLTLSNESGTQIDQVSYAANAVVGDYNRDGEVNAADYTVWRDNLGSTTELDADGNSNGIIDQGDYTAWRTNFGAIFSGSASAAGLSESTTTNEVATESAVSPSVVMPTHFAFFATEIESDRVADQASTTTKDFTERSDFTELILASLVALDRSEIEVTSCSAEVESETTTLLSSRDEYFTELGLAAGVPFQISDRL